MENEQNREKEGNAPVRRRPLTEEEKAARAARRPLTEEEKAKRAARRPLTEEEKAARAARRPLTEEEKAARAARRPLTEEERAQRAARRPLTEEEKAKKAARRPLTEEEKAKKAARRLLTEKEKAGRTERSFMTQEERAYRAAKLRVEQSEKAEERFVKKRSGKGLLIGLCTALVLLIIILALCIWQLQGSRNGGTTPMSLLFGKGGSNSEIPTLYTTEAPSSEETEQELSAEAVSGEEGTGEQSRQTEPSPSQTPTEAQTYQNDENGNLIIPERQEGSMETAPAWESVLPETGDEVLDTANRQAAMYDYDAAIATLQSVSGYESRQDYKDAIADYEERKSQVTAYNGGVNNTVTHIFFHTLAVDTSRCFSDEIAVSKQDGSNKVNAYNEVMTTVDEFVRIIEEMYSRGYVLVSIYDVAEYVTNEDGTQTMRYKPIYLPEGKVPFVLSVDDVSYYEYMSGHGFATKLVVGDDGKVTNEYVMADGSVVYGSYDVVTILEDFIETHPDFSYRGAKGIIALTGYEGIFGYRTCDYWYNWNCDYFNSEHAAKREQYYYNNENIEQDKQTAKQVAEAIKAQGWTFASHSWGHRDMGTISYEDFAWDTEMWEKEVEPLIGETDVIIFPKGADIDSWRGYAADNQKYQLLKSVGFNYFCNVDSSQYWVQIGENKDYFRMGRRNLDGTRMWEALTYYQNPAGGATDRLSDLFDSRLVFDWSRPTPVE